jgi:hypothetical protein
MSYLQAALLNQILTYEPVSSRGSTGYQDKTYGTAQSIACREETIAQEIVDNMGVTVLATSLVFVDPDIFSTPDLYARYTLPSGDVVRLAKAEAIKLISDTADSPDTITHWECYFTKA